MLMSVSSNNKPAFGCGACSKIHQQVARRICEEPSGLFALGVALTGGVKPFTKEVITNIIQEKGLTHGQAAKLYKSMLAERLAKK